jgi:hypothetical protein
MEDRVERLERLVEELVEEVRGMRLVLERLLRRRVRGKGKVEKGGSLSSLSVWDLSEEERELVRVFLDWARGKWSEWKISYEEGKMEGYDGRRGLVLLRKGTMNEFLDLMNEQGVMKQDVLRLLSDLKILKYWESGGRRQYCIGVRVDKPTKGIVSGFYVLVFKRMQEVSQELQGLSEGDSGRSE